MLTIREEQMNLLEMDKLDAWQQRLAGSIGTCYPQLIEQLGVDGLTAFINRSLTEGRGWGFRSGHDLSRFVNLSCALGPGFATGGIFPWARVLLEDGEMTPSGKMERLCWWARRTLRANQVEHAGS